MGRDTLSPGFLLHPTERAGRPASGSRNCVIRVFIWEVRQCPPGGLLLGPKELAGGGHARKQGVLMGTCVHWAR